MAIQEIKRKSGSRFRVHYRNPYTSKKEYLPLRATRKEAEKENDQIKYRLKHEPQTFLPPDFVPPTSSPTLSSLLAEYHRLANMTDVTRRETFYHVRRLLDYFPAMEVTTLTRSKVKEVERAMLADGMKQNTIQRRISILKSCLSWAVEEEIIEENPIQGYRCRRGEDLKLIPPTPEEVSSIYNHSPPHLRRALVLAYYLGVRVGPSELLGLSWENVDLERRKILVWAAKKNKRALLRELDLVDELASMLAVWKAEDMAFGTPWIIHYRGARVGSIKKSWHTAIEKAGITRRIVPYGLRHAFATQALSEGADIKAVAEAMGHNSTSMIHRHYQHVLDHQKKAVMESLPKLGIKEDSPETGIVVNQHEPHNKRLN